MYVFCVDTFLFSLPHPVWPGEEGSSARVTGDNCFKKHQLRHPVPCPPLLHCPATGWPENDLPRWRRIVPQARLNVLRPTSLLNSPRKHSLQVSVPASQGTFVTNLHVTCSFSLWGIFKQPNISSCSLVLQNCEVPRVLSSVKLQPVMY